MLEKIDHQKELEGKTLFVVSDLHIGDKSARDNFYHSGGSEAFDSFLEYVKKQPNAHLIILGDLFEFWQTNLSEVIVENLDLLDRITDKIPFTYVIGNHDIDLVKFIGTDLLNHSFFKHMTEDFTMKFGNDKTVAFLHGHEVDDYNTGLRPGLGRILSIFAGMIEDAEKTPFTKDGKESWEDKLSWGGEKLHLAWKLFLALLYESENLKKGLKELTPFQDPSRIEKVHLAVKKYKEENNLTAVVCGHTHKVGTSGDWYFNSGTWAAKRNTFLKISPKFEVQLFEWTNEGPVEFKNEITI